MRLRGAANKISTPRAEQEKAGCYGTIWPFATISIGSYHVRADASCTKTGASRGVVSVLACGHIASRVSPGERIAVLERVEEEEEEEEEEEGACHMSHFPCLLSV